MNTNIILLSDLEYNLRLQRAAAEMKKRGVKRIVITDSANIFYLTGRVFSGWIVVSDDASASLLVKRPSGLNGCTYIRKPEEILSHISIEKPVGLELETSSYASIERLRAALSLEEASNASEIMRATRAVKTATELDALRLSGVKHQAVYAHVPALFHEGMTDLELQIEIERISRLEGCLGDFRISGDTMEIYMGNLLAGKNADTPTPYDFAMGGAGSSPSLPVGADGSVMERGNSVMVDMNGNFTGYMTDMTRVFSIGPLDPLALKAHECSLAICHSFQEKARPGVAAKELYEMARSMAEEAGLADYFMGHRQKAGFVGHGVGIEINELPVIAPRSRDVIAEGNVIALEPKFVIPSCGAVGIENTYYVGKDRTECLTNAPEQIIDLL